MDRAGREYPGSTKRSEAQAQHLRHMKLSLELESRLPMAV